MIRWERVGVVAGKELRDTLRDRRTLLMMVLVPMLLYPLGGLALSQLTRSAMARIDREGYVVAVEGEGAAAEAARAALARDAALKARPAQDAEAALRGGKAEAALGIRAAAPAAAGQVTLELLYDAASPRSRAGLDRARRALEDEARERRAARLAALGLSEAQVTPLSIRERSVSSEGRAALSRLAPALALLLILLSLMGAFYPAIDLIAGERERGTLEPLLCTPASRMEIVAGKYACLAVLALSTCILNLAALGLTSGLMLRGTQLAIGAGPALLLLAATAPALLLVSALLLLAAVFARSFKDAQNLMTPVYLACIVPALCGLVPELHLSPGLALLPVLSSVLFIKDLVGGGLQLVPGFLAVASGLVHAALGVALAASVFERAGVGGARVADHGPGLLAEPAGPAGRPVITLTGALGVHGLCLALMLHVAPRLQRWDLRLGLVLTELGLVLLPVLLLLRVSGVPIAEGLGLRPLPARQCAGAALWGAGGAALGLWLFLFVVQPLLQPPPEYLRLLEALRPRTVGDKVVMLAVGAVLPALCEEALCRGLLLPAARRTLGAPAAVLLSAFLFAVLHVDPYRFAGTLLLGCLLGLCAVRAGSLLGSMIMHLCNNALAFLLGDWLEPHLARPGLVLHLALLGAAAVLLGGGLPLLRPPRALNKTAAAAP